MNALSGNDKEKKLASLGRITSASGQKADPKTVKSTITNSPRRYSLVARQGSSAAVYGR